MRISDWSSDVCSSDLRCLEAATQRPAEGETEAIRWKAAGGGVHARQCLGVALANQQRWMGAADEFEGAAKDAQAARDPDAGSYWAQAGNAWLAAGEAVNAQHALDARSEEHTSELQSLMRISYAVFCLKTNTKTNTRTLTPALNT